MEAAFQALLDAIDFSAADRRQPRRTRRAGISNEEGADQREDIMDPVEKSVPTVPVLWGALDLRHVFKPKKVLVFGAMEDITNDEYLARS